MEDLILETPSRIAATASSAPAETPPAMRKVMVEVELVNATDDNLCRQGLLPVEKVRRMNLTVLVDTGMTGLSLPESAIQKLGLIVIKEATSIFANGQTAKRKVYGSVIVNVMGRSSINWTVVTPAGVPPLLGQIPLEQMDLMVDSRNQRLVPGHPESPDMEVFENY